MTFEEELGKMRQGLRREGRPLFWKMLFLYIPFWIMVAAIILALSESVLPAIQFSWPFVIVVGSLIALRRAVVNIKQDFQQKENSLVLERIGKKLDALEEIKLIKK